MTRTFIAGIFVLALLIPPQWADSETEAERRKRLETELQNVERQILTQQRLVEDKQQERQTLERDLTIIEGEIKKAQLGIQARAVAIEQLSDQIGEKEVVLDILAERLAKQQESLADLVRKSALLEDYSLVEVMLSKQSFSEFFTDVATYQSIKESLNESLAVLHGIRRDTVEQKNELENKQQTEAEMKRIQELQKDDIEAKEAEKARILTVTKGEEEEYQALLDSQRKTAAQLRSALFELLGGGGGIPFPDAVALAQYASGVTGVSAALILAILEQETNIGSNLGSCLFSDSHSSRPVMHPTRDEPVFLAIADILGFDPYSRTVSCPIMQNGSRVGWGGAMGPSQFIPSTWAIYGGIINIGGEWTYDKGSDAIRRINGNNTPANPFNNRDAFIATALLLRDNGANGTYSGDRLAALRYYAGWGGASNPANAFYGDQVMNRKSRLAQEIQILGS
ncbi:MAG: lytic murein transglycosylase [Candidatus Kaiserbacteria bacterium]|nr:lytic murein transglycosylase [Candidatus Kaiserbacteria bacterium]MCB9816257.1 lytic murein transglycosylase [Candidatus Nomurabacteria bacterium]